MGFLKVSWQCDSGQSMLIPSQSTLKGPARRCPLAGMRRERALRSARRLVPMWTKLYVSLSLLSSMRLSARLYIVITGILLTPCRSTTPAPSTSGTSASPSWRMTARARSTSSAGMRRRSSARGSTRRIAPLSRRRPMPRGLSRDGLARSR